MKKSLSHLPQSKQEELRMIIQITKRVVEPVMVILFGSFARGDWVEDEYEEGHITYSYQSDYDLLIIGKDKEISKNIPLLFKLEDEIRKKATLKTPVSILIDSLDFVNEKLDEGRYFYVDIKKEGIMLYDSGEFALRPIGKPDKVKQRQMAEDDFLTWMEKASQSFWQYDSTLKKEWNNPAAFHLHQVAESLFTAVQLVFTGYRPKTHNLERLLAYSVKCDSSLKKVFKFETNEENRLFQLLKRAYVDARYRKDYKITHQELEYLAEKLKMLQRLVKKVCERRIVKI